MLKREQAGSFANYLLEANQLLLPEGDGEETLEAIQCSARLHKQVPSHGDNKERSCKASKDIMIFYLARSLNG